MPRFAARVGRYGALATLAGALLSGPIAVTIVEATHPQPRWRDAATFAASYHPLQLLPYLFGFVLVAGCVVMIAALHSLAEPRRRVLTSTALVLASAFAAFVLLNYVLQTTVVPELARDADANGALIAALSLSNPRSLGWALEMWGYGFLGAASWLAAPAFGRHGLAHWSFVANGPISLVGAALTTARPGWEMAPAGVVAFAGWNLLVVVMALAAFTAFGRAAPLRRMRSSPATA